MSKNQASQNTFISHLSELRSRLVKSFIFLIISFIICYFFSEEIYRFFKDNNGTSLLCREESNIHPYRAFYSLEGHRGKKIIEHDLCRRQDYPICFMSSYFLAILKVPFGTILIKNLYIPSCAEGPVA